MEQFFLRAVKARLPAKANTDFSHRPALVAESLSAFTMAFLHSGHDFMQPKQGLRARCERCVSDRGETKSFITAGGRRNKLLQTVIYGRLLLCCHLLLVFTAQVQQLCLSSRQSWWETNHRKWEMNFKSTWTLTLKLHHTMISLSNSRRTLNVFNKHPVCGLNTGNTVKLDN